ncbi:MAG: MFS transporter [Planctomycetota bacterium]|jgi:MFS family permease
MSQFQDQMQDGKKGNFIVEYFRNFRVLKDTRREYWAMQVINFIDHTIFFALITIGVVFFSDTSEAMGWEMSDQLAGGIFTIFGSGTTICLFFSGLVSDWLGIRRSMLINQLAMLVIRGVIVFVTLKRELFGDWGIWIMASAFCLQAPFLALSQTAFQAANKRYTTAKSRSAGFNFWYLCMNIGAFLAGLLIDLLYLHFDLPRVHVFSVGVGTAVVCLLVIAMFIRREDQLIGADEESEADEGDPRAETGSAEDNDAPVAKSGEVKRLNPWANTKAVLSEPVFWRFTCLITLLLGVRAVFLYMHLLMPKYWMRVIGPDAAIGTLEALNPFLVIIGLVLLIPVLHRFSVYKMLVYGAMISAVSLFIMAIPMYGDFSFTAPGVGELIWNYTYVISVIALVVLTVGEVIWSPRLTEYTAAIAPPGQEGTYLGLSMVPYFAAKTVVSLASGFMLAKWVTEPPEDDPLFLRKQLEAGEITFWDGPSGMWMMLAIIAFAGPLIALLLRRWFTKGAHFERGEGKA